MFILVNTHNGPIEFYHDMIAGMVCHIVRDENQAKQFKSESEASAEREKYKRHLSFFQIVKL